VGEGSGGGGLGEAACVGLGLEAVDGLEVGSCAVCPAQPAPRVSSARAAMTLISATYGDEIAGSVPLGNVMGRVGLSVHCQW
jgi:hypothetical protein